MTKIFISYSSLQTTFALTLNEKLNAAGYSTHIYARDGRRGESPRDVIDTCDMQLVLVNSKAVTSPNIRLEMKQFQTAGKPILALMLEPVILPDEIDKARVVYHMDDLDASVAGLVVQIEQARMASNPPPNGLIFISYPRSETAFAQRIDTNLQLEGYKTWLYARDYDPQQDREAQITDVIAQATLQLVVVTQRALSIYSNLRFEYQAMSMLGKPIIPLALYPVGRLPKELSKIPPIDFQQDFDVAIEQLLQSVRAVMQAAQVVQATPIPAPSNVLVAYYDLGTASGLQNAARTITEALQEQGFNATVANYNGFVFNELVQQVIDQQDHVVLILSRSTLAAFANDNALKPALEYMFAQGRNIVPVTISNKKSLGRKPASLGALWDKLNAVPPLYLPPVYVPSSDTRDEYIQPLLGRLQQPDATTPSAYELAQRIESQLEPQPNRSSDVIPLDEGLSHHIFLSYKRMDGETMRSVRDDLEAAGFIVWTDELIEKGTPQWQREIERAIRNTATLVCLLSPEAAQSDYVREELAAAKLFKKPIFLAMIRGSREACFIYGYMNSQMTDLRDPTHYNREFPLMVEAIKRRL